MKSVRKRVDPTIPKAQSLQSVKADDVPVANDDPNNSWLPPKQLLKPLNQLQLTEKELDEEITRILNACNPHAPQNISRYSNKENQFKTVANMEHTQFHFEVDGYMVWNGADEEETVQTTTEQGTESETPEIQATTTSTSTEKKQPLRNQFNYSERASQTAPFTTRSRFTNTEPPPTRSFSECVNQYVIFDSYVEDVATKTKTTRGDKKKQNVASVDVLPSDLQHQEDVYYKYFLLIRNPELRKVMVIAERMANQNTYDDVAQDYKYWNDMSDELSDKKTGSLLPLWNFSVLGQYKKSATCVEFTKFEDLVCVGYGTFEFLKHQKGMICLFSFKNPSYPEFVIETHTSVTCLHVHPVHTHLIVAGFQDGNVAVYNLKSNSCELNSFQSGIGSTTTSAHSDTVSQIRWGRDDLDDHLVFYSIACDGKVKQWTCLKNDMVHTDVICLKYSDSNKDQSELVTTASGTCFDFFPETYFLCGTEEGYIYYCSKEYTSSHLNLIQGHSMSVYGIRVNPFANTYYISAGSDWLVKLWKVGDSKHIMSFDIGSSVNDIVWSPYSATTFALVNAQGRLQVWDLSIDKSKPVCDQQITKKCELTCVTFSRTEPVVCAGDKNGNVHVLKVSPNLRKRGVEGDDQAERIQKVVDQVMGKSALEIS